MKNYINVITRILLIALIGGIGFTSCNKKLPDAIPLLYPKNGDTTMFGALNRDTSLSFYKAMVVKGGLTNLFNDNTTIFTAFIPNNNAFIASGIPSVAFINAFIPAASCAGIVSYSLIPGVQFIDTLTTFSTTFPNVQLPSYITIASIPGTVIPINLPIFPSKRPTGFWANNIPMIASNLRVQNGIIHLVSRIVSPPQMVLAQQIGSDPNLTLFSAAINRADSGQTPGLSSINYILAYPVANLTVFAPTNTAMKTLINALSGGLIPLAAPDAVFIAFINNFVPVQTARGIVVYHIMPYRAFSVNFTTTATFFPTLLNQAIPLHPGVKVQTTFIGGFGVALAAFGVGNGGAPAISTAPTNLDKNAVNGVEHVIDRVLLPQ